MVYGILSDSFGSQTGSGDWSLVIPVLNKGADMKRIRRILTGLILILSMLVLAVSCASYDEYDEEQEVQLLPLAILDFEVQSSVPGYEPLAISVPEAITEALLRGEVFIPVERSALGRILAEQELSMTGMVDATTAVKIGQLAGVRYVMTGTVAVVGDQIRLSCRIIDVETAEIVYAGSVYGEDEYIFDLGEELAEQVEWDFS
jgi:TolB-like protein